MTAEMTLSTSDASRPSRHSRSTVTSTATTALGGAGTGAARCSNGGSNLPGVATPDKTKTNGTAMRATSTVRQRL